MGTGIGGAFYSEASGIYQGSRHRANEIGYLLYREEDGKTYEQRASTSALKNLMTKYQFEYGTDVPKIFDLAEEGNEEDLIFSMNGVIMLLKELLKFKLFMIQA